MKKAETQFHFHITDFECSSEELTEAIGITPTVCYRKGDVRRVGKNGEGRVTIHHNTWQLESGLGSSASINDHLDWFMQKIEPHFEALKMATQQYSAELSFGIYYYEVNPGIHIEADHMKKIGELGAELDLDFYFLGEDEE